MSIEYQCQLLKNMYYLRYLRHLIAFSTISGCGIYLHAPNIEQSDI